MLDASATQQRRIVLVMAETPDYRRAAVVHTCIGDSFLEIGCDFGPTVDRVHRALHDIPSVPLDAKEEPIRPPDEADRSWCMGVDKSTESIAVANTR